MLIFLFFLGTVWERVTNWRLKARAPPCCCICYITRWNVFKCWRCQQCRSSGCSWADTIKEGVLHTLGVAYPQRDSSFHVTETGKKRSKLWTRCYSLSAVAPICSPSADEKAFTLLMQMCAAVNLRWWFCFQWWETTTTTCILVLNWYLCETWTDFTCCHRLNVATERKTHGVMRGCVCVLRQACDDCGGIHGKWLIGLISEGECRFLPKR